MEIQKLEYLENKKDFLDEIKNIFHSFWMAVIWLKKNWSKIVDTSFMFKPYNLDNCHALERVLTKDFGKYIWMSSFFSKDVG